jgi:acetone carboxylase gamma subunit
MTTEYSEVLIADLLRGGLSPSEVERMQRREKDPDRFEKVLRVEQERLGWSDRILVCLQEHLYVVEEVDGSRVVRCDCGHEFGDYRRNWKEMALVYERDPRDGLIYRGPRAADPDWHVLREFYCPGCASQLDVEMVPKGYPFIFNFIPDIEGQRARSEGSG